MRVLPGLWTRPPLSTIQTAMTPEQILAIRDMRLTQEDVRAFSQANGIVGQGPGPGMGQGMGNNPNQDLSPEERPIRMITTGGKAQVDELIRRLEIWSA